MKRYFLYSAALAAALMLAFAACRDKIDPQQQMLDAVNALLASGGDLQITSEEKNETTLLSRDSLPRTSYMNLLSETLYDVFPVKTTKRYNVTDNPMELVTLDPWDELWPGALIQGGALRNGVPTAVPIEGKRLPGKITLSVVSGNENTTEWAKEVPMRHSDVTQAMNELMRNHLGGSFSARTSFEITSVSSVEELALKLGINIKLFGGKLRTEFGNSWNTEKSYVAVKLNQLFFTINYDDPDGGFSGVFTDDITTDDLKNYTGPGNPICYVSSVSYGRSFILLYESEKDLPNLEIALNKAYNTIGTTNITNDQRSVVNSATCKLVQIGGDPQAGMEAVFGNFNAIRNFVRDGATVSATNLGTPISYKIKHLHDNTPACLTNTMEYTVSTTEHHPVWHFNDVVIDVFNLKMGHVDGGGSNIGPDTYIQLKELWVSNEGRGVKLNRAFDDKRYWAHIGSNISICNVYAVPTSAGNDDRIRIHCRFYVQVQTSTSKTGKDVLFIQDFSYVDGTWQPVSPAETWGNATIVQNQPFTRLQMTEKVGSASADITFNYRFTCDGQVYPKK